MRELQRSFGHKTVSSPKDQDIDKSVLAILAQASEPMSINAIARARGKQAHSGRDIPAGHFFESTRHSLWRLESIGRVRRVLAGRLDRWEVVA
ncbi:hypothetical protein [Chitinolyticbacter meiyuanensis]|uniref:hypothetical protein n=1 Tax=Chitinolyticbacter meiyuanensis TaxID=682798 RepID=UPI001651FDD8|nr:hypothetical protein [Chitinolyticbacter meiyuanensis]